MSFGFFVFRFTNSKGMDHVIFDGPWALDDVVHALDHWSLGLRSSLEVLLRVMVWMRLSNLPPVL